MKKIVIVDYEMGNVASVHKALKAIGASPDITREPATIRNADYIVLPGVGAFGKAMQNLKKFDLIPLLEERVIREKTPFLGICLGMQILADRGNEFGTHNGMSWIAGEVREIPIAPGMRLPHVGWDDITITDASSALFKDVHDLNFYFVHSYYFAAADSSALQATCEYGIRFPACVKVNNITATQFHPEKSQTSGLQFLRNWLYEYA